MNIEAFFSISYGLYLVCSKDGTHFNGHASNTVFQVSATPPVFAIASHKDNLTTSYIQKSGVFSVSVLRQDTTLEFLGPWGFKTGRMINKFKGIDFKIGKTGAPIVVEHSVAYLECEVIDQMDTGTHILFLGRVVGAEILDEWSSPLTYKYYREVIKGLSPENSPTYTEHEIEMRVSHRKHEPGEKPGKWQCTVCGHIYDPEEGDPDGGIPPGTAFEDIPDDWVCPVCGVSKEDFVMIDD